MTCPIGLPGIAGKEPAVIAASVVAQLLALSPPAPPPAQVPAMARKAGRSSTLTV